MERRRKENGEENNSLEKRNGNIIREGKQTGKMTEERRETIKEMATIRRRGEGTGEEKRERKGKRKL